MNLRFKPSSIQTINNPTNRSSNGSAFLWFNSWDVSVGVVIEKEDLDRIRRCLDEIEPHIDKDKTYIGKIEVVEQ